MPVNPKTDVRPRTIFTLIALALITALIIIPTYFRSSASSQKGLSRSLRTESFDPDLPNYDIRQDKSAMGKLAAFRTSQSKNAVQVADIRDQFVAGEKELALRVPTLKVEYNSDLHIPEVIAPDVKQGKAFLSSASSEKHSAVLLDFLRQNAALTGVASEQVDQLKVFSDYTNPNGNLSFVEIDQEINGIPVFRGEVKAGFTKQGEMIRVINNLAPGLDYNSLSSDFRDPMSAVTAAAGFINHKMTPGEAALNKAESTDLKAVFGSGDWASTAEKMYFPTEPGVAVPAWRVLIWQPVNAYYVIVDAETGTMLWRKNISNDQTQSATYRVYSSTENLGLALDSPSPGNPIPGTPDPTTVPPFQAALVQRPIGGVTLIGNEGNLSFNNLGWITDGSNDTNGNNVEAGLDRDTTNGVDTTNGRAIGTNRVFDFAWTPSNVTGGAEGGDAPLIAGEPASPCTSIVQPHGFTEAQKGAITNLFYLANRYHDALYLVGFNEAAHNFQNNNFGRGGVGSDAVSAETDDCSGTNNANFATPADGGRGRMQMFLFTNGTAPARDGSLDANVVWHEHTHGVSNRLIGNGSGLTSTQGGGMGEGWSDLFAFLLGSKTNDPANGVYTTGGYVTYKCCGLSTFTSNYYYGIRRFPYAAKSVTGGPNNRPHNPLTFADIDPAQISLNDGAFARSPLIGGAAAEVHNEGELWAVTGVEVWSRLVTRLQHDPGTLRTLQLYTDGMKLSPLSPSFLQERDALIAAAQASGGTDVDDIWSAFAARGMGFSATNPSGNTVVEAFDLPNVTQTDAITINDATGNNNGFPEPGELVTVNIPFNNNTGKTATSVSFQLVGGGSANLATFPNNTVAIAQLQFIVPAGTPCGSTLGLTINVNSSLGATSFNRTIVIGVPSLTLTQNFDGVTAPTIPAGWTATSVSGGITFATVTTNVDSAPNSAFSVDPVAGPAGEGDLTSPSIPISSAAATVSFRNRFDTEPAWDGSVLEVSIAGGAFTDIISAGGVFVSNGYNGTMTAAVASPTYTPNPLNGRNGWTGNSNGFVTTVLRLPASAAGQNIRLRWRAGADDNTAGVGPNPGVYIDTIQVFGAFTCSAPTTIKSRADFDHDGKTDISVFRPSDGNWYTLNSTGVGITNWGAPTDVPVPGDYDGDGKADVAVYRPSLGEWFILRSSDSTVNIATWGAVGDKPVAADYDGDGKTDISLFRPSDGNWYTLLSFDGSVSVSNWGNSTDVPVPGDYDGDGKSDVAVFRPSSGQWFILRSTAGVLISGWGATGDKPVEADYDGDNKDDIAVFRPSDGNWYILRSSDGAVEVVNWGNSTDVPVPGDYDGDGKDDEAIFRNGTWFILQSAGSPLIASWGVAGDIPIPAKYIP